MKLLYPKWDLHIGFDENLVSVLILENPKDLTELVSDLLISCENGTGETVLFDGEKTISLSKNAEILLNPLLTEVNTKKVINKLYQELLAVATDKFSVEKQKVQAEWVKLLDSIVSQVPYPVVFEPEVSLTELFKISEVSIDTGGPLPQRLADQIQTMGLLTGIKLLIYVGLKSYLTIEELRELYKTAFYSKVNMLLIEAEDKNRLNDAEKTWIIDKDHCIINF